MVLSKLTHKHSVSEMDNTAMETAWKAKFKALLRQSPGAEEKPLKTSEYSAPLSKFEQNTPWIHIKKVGAWGNLFGFTTGAVRPFGFVSAHYLPGIQSSSPVQADNNENKVDTCMV
jgi:hypothetical protein